MVKNELSVRTLYYIVLVLSVNVGLMAYLGLTLSKKVAHLRADNIELQDQISSNEYRINILTEMYKRK